MPRYVITPKDPHRFGNGSLKAGDEIELNGAEEAHGEFMKRLGYLDDPPAFPPRTQRAPRRGSAEPAPEPTPAPEPERSSLPITHHEAEVAPISAEVSAVADAVVIRATDQEVDPAPETDDPSRYERRDMRPEE